MLQFRDFEGEKWADFAPLEGEEEEEMRRGRRELGVLSEICEFLEVEKEEMVRV